MNKLTTKDGSQLTRRYVYMNDDTWIVLSVLSKEINMNQSKFIQQLILQAEKENNDKNKF